MKTNISIVIVVVAVIAVVLTIRGNSQESADTYSVAGTISTSTLPIVTEMKAYSLFDISSHKDEKSCYSAINGSVYDLTQWIEVHPGGAEKILLLCGIDGTKEFNEQHGTNNEALSRLASFKIGILE